MQQHLFILGGTAEARELAARLADDSRWRVTTSLAGRTAVPKLPKGDVRIGGFGGAAALASYIQQDEVSAVIDASHPFATRISRSAMAAAETARVPLLWLERPPWQPVDGDQWQEIGDWPEAEALLPPEARVFLAIGRQELGAFSGLLDRFFLVRMVDEPATPLPLAQHTVILGRGPFLLDDEQAILRRHGITHVVAKNSGGAGAYAKLEAARTLGLPVILKRRPAMLRTERATRVDDALSWIELVAGRLR